MTRSFFARVLTIGAALTLSGCFTTRVEPLRPLTVTLRSSTPVQLFSVGADGNAETSRCPSLDAVVTVAQLRGDTLFYERITSLRVPPNFEPCNRTPPGYIDLASQPSLTMLNVRRSRLRTALWGAAMLVLVISVVNLRSLSR